MEFRRWLFRSHAIIAQSIGGGGGLAGDVSLPLQLDRDAWGGSSGGEPSSGNGHAVNVTVNGPIATTGDGAFRITAQSLSGGGGLGGERSEGRRCGEECVRSCRTGWGGVP